MSRPLSKTTLKIIDDACAHYPSRKAAMLPALHAVMDADGHIGDDALHGIASALDVHPTKVLEAATFYTMFVNEATGRTVVKICRNLACQLRGADRLIALAQERLGIGIGETTPDGRITLATEECLASCGTAPVLWSRTREEAHGEWKVQERIVENLDEKRLLAFLEESR